MTARRVERTLDLAGSPREVWTALTRGERMSAWFGAAVTIDARTGGRVSFEWPDGSRRAATIETLEPQRLLVLRWLPFARDPGGVVAARPTGVVTFVVEEIPHGSRLRVSETVLLSRAEGSRAAVVPEAGRSQTDMPLARAGA